MIFGGEIFSLSISSLMVLLSILGLAISNEKLYYLEVLKRKKDYVLYESGIEENQQLEVVKALYERAKVHWKVSSPKEKMLLKASGIFDLEAFEQEIAMLEANNIDINQNKR